MKTILTTMIMVYKSDGSFLVQNRLKQDWPGINFPGGHVEEDESTLNGAIREMKEETGLEVYNLESPGYIEWCDLGDDKRHLAIIFRTKDFKGEIHSSKEGEVFFVKEQDLKNYSLSNDFMTVLNIARKGLNI